MIFCLYISELLAVVYMITHQAGIRGNFWWLFVSTFLFIVASRQYDKLKDRVESLEEDKQRYDTMWKNQVTVNENVVNILNNNEE